MPESTVFQTKDLDCDLTEFTISADGALMKPGFPIHFHGEIKFYTEKAGTLFEYTAKFADGKLQGIDMVDTVNIGKPARVIDTPN